MQETKNFRYCTDCHCKWDECDIEEFPHCGSHNSEVCDG